MARALGRFEDLGPNSGLVEEMYREFLENPDAVSEAWREFFDGYVPRGGATSGGAVPPAGPPRAGPIDRAPVIAAAPPPTSPATAPSAPAFTAAPPPPLFDGAVAEVLRGASARIVTNMEASLALPTATSVRTVPAKLLEINRVILNNHLARTRGGKVSFTHLIAFAALRALERVPAMNRSFAVEDGKPAVVHHEHVNLGLAVDVEKSDGSRTLLVPNIRAADTRDFAGFFAAYEELIRKVRTGKIGPDDFAGTTCSITNPGMIGTEHSVPRLMPGQGLILGVGSIGFPAEYEGADDRTLARVGVGKVVTLTSTYDHRVIQGAQSGEFLRWIHSFLIGEHGFYDDVFASFGVPYEPARWVPDTSPLDSESAAVEKVVHVQQLINMYRVRGHLLANLDPLGRREPRTHSELDITEYGLTIWDLDREFAVGSLGLGNLTTDRLPLRDILGILRDAYSRAVGVEFMHIQEPEQKEWIQSHVEGATVAITPDEQRRILDRLNAAEAFEAFLQKKYLGQKRFSLEGAESLVPMLDELLTGGVREGMGEAVLGMAHRGRLNVLVNIVGKSYGQIFREFDGALDPASVEGSGDVKYHLGAVGTHVAPDGGRLVVTLASNPSHLEAVDPIVEGMARAKEDRRRPEVRGSRVLPILVHGDAGFAGQGVVAETFNLSEVPGFEVGGTVHIVVNNQLGFTTPPEQGRSGVYATDVAKMVQAPIFHVNGDDPEACVRVIKLALAFRQRFRKDVVVDMLCYRRWGHNEADEPAFTQPRMYALIGTHRSVRKLYTEVLVNRGDLSVAEAEASLDDFRARMENAFEETRQSAPPERPPERAEPVYVASPDTGVARETLERIVDAASTWPDGFHPHPKLEKLIRHRRDEFVRDDIDWALAEALAFGSLLVDGVTVRLTGQDTRRGTFSQRHGVLVDVESEAEYTPLDHIAPSQARFRLHDTVLSEYAALGFEYGYSVGEPQAFVGWEAQFGDFANGAQTIIDEFVVAAEDKWGQTSRLALLLPHAFEGQGPDHSSARIERFLALCAQDNIRVVYPSTAAQYFHVLRRQARSAARRPLVCFTPKRYLRMPATRCTVAELTDGRFLEVLDDPSVPDPATVRRVLLCTGKVGHELLAERDARGVAAAVVRVEQLYPWPEPAVLDALDHYPAATQVFWVQEEPANMGPWNFAHGRLHRILRDRAELRHVARAATPSPATGSHTVHEAEQAQLLAEAFTDLD